MIFTQSTAADLPVLMIDSADHLSGKTGLTLTITARKAGGSFASISPTVTELANGWYNLALTTTHLDTVGAFALHITASGADANDQLHQVGPITMDLKFVDGSNPAATNFKNSLLTMYVGTITGATTTSTLIDSGLTQTLTDHWAGRILIFITSTNGLAKVATQITGFNPATDQLTFTAVPATPASGDTYVIL